MKLPPASPATRALGLGAALFLLYGLLGSQQYTDVDGALRCLEVFRRPVLFFSGNNHLLYPANVFLWHRLLGVFGIAAGNAVDYLQLTQLMNAMAAAACAALLYWIVRTTTSSEVVALAAAAGLALSRAFLLHATNSAEPMVGLLWSLVALAGVLVAVRRGSVMPAVLAGVALALSLATYESMVMIAPAALLLSLRGTRPRGRTVALLASAAAATAAIYGFAYASSGTPAPLAMVRRFLEVPGASVWGGASAGKFANLPAGLAQSVLPVLPLGYGGIRSLFRPGGSVAGIIWLGLATAAFVALAAAVARKAWRERAALRGETRSLLVALAAGLSFAILVPLAWDPLYDKLWLQPLALALLVGGLLAGAKAPRPRATVALLAALLVVLEVNLSLVLAAHRNQSPYLEASRAVARTVRRGDLLVHEWDPVSQLYVGLWDAGTANWDLPGSAVIRGPAAVRDLDSAVAAARGRGAAVYFLAVLDEERGAWDAFLGRRLHLPFAALDRYRDSARIVVRLGAGASGFTLRKL